MTRNEIDALAARVRRVLFCLEADKRDAGRHCKTHKARLEGAQLMATMMAEHVCARGNMEPRRFLALCGVPLAWRSKRKHVTTSPSATELVYGTILPGELKREDPPYLRDNVVAQAGPEGVLLAEAD